MKNEMEWTKSYFKFHAAKWTARKAGCTSGARAYAARQAAMWERFAQEAADEFGMAR